MIKKKKCNECGRIPARYICTQCGRSFCTSCMSEKEFVCNLCKIGRRGARDESNNSAYSTFKQDLIQGYHLVFLISIAIIVAGITLIAVSFSYYLPLTQITNNDYNNNNSGNSSAGFIYIFPLPFAIPIDSALVPHAIPILLVLVFAIPIIVVLIVISKRFFLYNREY
jgi:hypothetical protein